MTRRLYVLKGDSEGAKLKAKERPYSYIVVHTENTYISMEFWLCFTQVSQSSLHETFTPVLEKAGLFH